MTKKSNDENFKNRVAMYFSDPSTSLDEYRNEYKSRYNESYIKKCKGIGFSPLYLLRRDICFCLGPYGYSKKCNYRSRESALFAGIILMDIAFRILVKKLFNEKFDEKKNFTIFAKKYVGIREEWKLQKIRDFRNALEHNNFYSLLCIDKNGSKIYFSLDIKLNKLIEKDKKNGKRELYKINPMILHKDLEGAINKLKKDIVNKKNGFHEKFIKNICIKDWTRIG